MFPTGYHGTDLAGVGPGDTVAVFGAGPVGLMAAHSAFLRGADRVFVVDKEADRLRLAAEIDAVPVDLSAGPRCCSTRRRDPSPACAVAQEPGRRTAPAALVPRHEGLWWG